MARVEQTVAVLIADVCGSTPLYESSGNLKALDLIAECLDNISRIVEAEGGTVLRPKENGPTMIRYRLEQEESHDD